jgi:hypothetical protein
VLPAGAASAKSSIGDAELAKVPSSTLASRTAEEGREVTQVGRLVWNDQQLGWTTERQMEWQGRSHRQQPRGVTFDEAFRRANRRRCPNPFWQPRSGVAGRRKRDPRWTAQAAVPVPLRRKVGVERLNTLPFWSQICPQISSILDTERLGKRLVPMI